MADIAEGKRIILNDEFREAFRYFYNEVKNYKDKHYDKGYEPRYADISDYISGYLSTDEGMDLDWFLNERDTKDFSNKFLNKIIAFCEKKIFEENRNYIDDDEDFSF